jgi:hypothetical protein
VRLAVDVPGQVLGRPADLEQRLLEPPALARVHQDRVLVDPGASIGAIFFCRTTSSSTARSRLTSANPYAGYLTSWSRPYRSIVSATSTSSACGTAYRE